MKKLAILAAFAMTTTGAFAADIEGVWKTAKDDNGNYGHIKVAPCGSAFCGTLIKSFKSDGSNFVTKNIGKKIIWDMKDGGSGYYSGGKVWSPDRNKTYKSKLQVNGNTLNVKGCVGPICRDGGTWTKVK